MINWGTLKINGGQRPHNELGCLSLTTASTPSLLFPFMASASEPKKHFLDLQMLVGEFQYICCWKFASSISKDFVLKRLNLPLVYCIFWLQTKFGWTAARRKNFGIPFHPGAFYPIYRERGFNPPPPVYVPATNKPKLFTVFNSFVLRIFAVRHIQNRKSAVWTQTEI
jgi:hypothetical protein